MKKGWKVRNSFCATPTCPASVEAITDMDHAVMLSAIGKSRRARPWSSVISSGFQTSVSGKYFRSRGVNSGLSADGVPGIVFATVLATAEDSVFKVTASALTSTASDTVPTCKVDQGSLSTPAVPAGG